MNVYLAGSWRTGGARLDVAAAELRRAGHEVFDFRAGSRQLTWEEVGWRGREADQKALIECDEAADRWRPCVAALAAADALVLVEPSGRSAHLEAGYAAGRGLPVIVWLAPDDRPELASLLAGWRCVSLDEVTAVLRLAVTL